MQMQSDSHSFLKESFLIKIKRMLKAVSYLRYFDMRVFIAKEFNIISNASLKSKQSLDRAILIYLKKEYGYLLKRYNSEWSEHLEKPINAPIWVFWWQGFEDMPDIIKVCQRSIEIFSSNHPVVLLTKDNIKQYVNLSKEIWQRYELGEIRIQHLADIIRVKLIRDFGGLWLDASVFCTKPIPEEYFNKFFYSIRKPNTPEEDDYNISLNRWTTFVIGGWKNNILCSFLSDFFDEYCKKERYFVDYFLFDCAIALAYENIHAAKSLIDELPVISEDYYIISRYLQNSADDELLEKIYNQGFVFNKISYGKCNELMTDNSLYKFLRDGKFFEKSQCDNSGLQCKKLS